MHNATWKENKILSIMHNYLSITTLSISIVKCVIQHIRWFWHSAKFIIATLDDTQHNNNKMCHSAYKEILTLSIKHFCNTHYNDTQHNISKMCHSEYKEILTLSIKHFCNTQYNDTQHNIGKMCHSEYKEILTLSIKHICNTQYSNPQHNNSKMGHVT
jgi:hypothetical protein